MGFDDRAGEAMNCDVSIFKNSNAGSAMLRDPAGGKVATRDAGEDADDETDLAGLKRADEPR